MNTNIDNKVIYFEKKKQESHTNIFKSLQIENYFKQSLKKQGFQVHDCKLNLSNAQLYVFLSIYVKKIKNKKKTKHDTSKKNNELPILSFTDLKNYEDELNQKVKNNFWRNSIKSLNRLTNNQFQIVFKIKWVSKKFLKKTATKPIFDLKYRMSIPEMKRLYLVLIKQKNTAELLSNFIVEQLKTTKRHNFFLTSFINNLKLIIRQRESKIRGIKILLKGRLNNAPRSRNRVIKIGKVPIITQNIHKNYAESTSFTSNGTIGIKIWIS